MGLIAAKLATKAFNLRSVIYLSLALFFGVKLRGQVSEDFSDGDFTNDPVWISSNVSGTGVDFTVYEGELRSAGPASASTLGISTVAIPDLATNDVFWTFSVRYGSGTPNPSGSNNIRVYLVSNNSDLGAVSSGYFIQMGEGGSGDGIDLFAIGVNEPLIEDTGNQVADGINVTIQVTRDAEGEWSLLADNTGGTSFNSIGTYNENSSPEIGSFFGFQVNHTSSNNDNFYLDDVGITTSPVADIQPPSISSVSVLSSTSLVISFSEEVDEVSAEIISNYDLTPSVPISSAEKQVSDGKEIILRLADALNNGTRYNLSIAGIKDLSNNTLTIGEINFDYLLFSDPVAGDVVLNEFLVAPNDDEFVELFNNSEKIFNLENWTIEDEIGNMLKLPEYRFDPGEYVVITSESGVDSLHVAGFPLFNNSSDELILKSHDGTFLQSLAYSSFQEGNSYELINTAQLCKGIGNYVLNEEGNSAGKVNDNKSDVRDQEGPRITSIFIEAADSLIIVFDEPISEVSSLRESVVVNDQEAFAAVLSPDKLTLNVKLSEALLSEQPGTLVLLNVSDCLGNQRSLDTTLYLDQKAPELQSLIAISNTELLLNFQEQLEIISLKDFGKFSLLGQIINQVDETDTAQNTLLVELENELVLNSSHQLVINGLEDTLGNAVIADTSSFTFRSDIKDFEVIASNVVEITSSKAVDTTRLASQNFWIKEYGFAAAITKLDSTRFQVAFGEAFEKNENLRIYLLDLFGSNGQTLLTPALEVYVDRQEPSLTAWEAPHPDSLFLFFDEPLNPSSAVNFSHYLIEGRTPRDLFLLSDTSAFIQPPFSFEQEITYELQILGIEDTLGNAVATSQKYEITFDTLAPEVLSIQQFSMEKLRVVFNEPLDISHAIVFGISAFDEYNIADVEYISETEVNVDYRDSIPQEQNLEVFLTGGKDGFGNEQSDTLLLTIDTRLPGIVEIQPISRNAVTITYNQNMSVTAENISSYNLLGSSAAEVRFSYGGYVAEFDTTMSDHNVYEIYIGPVTNSSGVPLPDTVIGFQFDSRLENFPAIYSQKITLQFQEEIRANSSLEVSIESSNVQYQGASLLEPSVYEVILEEPLPENEPLSIQWDSAHFANRLILPAYDTTFTYDTEAPFVQGVSSEFLSQIVVNYSESIPPSIGLEAFNYVLNTGLFPREVRKVSDTEFRLDFDTLVTDSTYQLIVKNLTDLSGNRRTADTIQFLYQPPRVPRFHELRITEIMADPSPTIGLPNVEFLELWNASSDVVSLSGVMLEDQSGFFPFPNVCLQPGQYIAFAETAEAPFSYFENFPFLTNRGERILLRTIYGDIVDSVTYSSSWMSSPMKRDGGYSLELLNLETNCDGPANWEASMDSLGGTPGRSNSFDSHFSDTIPPHVTSVHLIDSFSARISFNEYMDTTIVSDEYSESHYMSFQEVLLVFISALVPGTLTEVSIGQFQDCSGNSMNDTTLTLALPRSPVIGDLVITEIMPDPIPQVGLSDGEYVELLNLTEEVIDLSGLTLNGSSLCGSLFPKAYLTLIPSALSGDKRYRNTQIVSPWLGLKNEVDTVVLSFANEVLVELAYSDDWYRSEEKSGGGYSLELINIESSCAGPANWSASLDSLGGSPGRVNSIISRSQDVTAPSIRSVELLDSTSVILTFDEYMDTTVMDRNFSNGYFVSLQDVKLGFDSAFIPGSIGALSIGQFKDCSGNQMVDTTVSVVIPRPPIFGELMITEMMPDPTPQVGLADGEYVELLNLTDDVIDLSELTINGVPLQGELLSGAYATLIPSALSGDQKYHNAQVVRPWIGLKNDRDTLILASDFEVLVELVYTTDWYHSEEKAAGGFSLEVIDPFLVCGGAENWTSNTSALGGTPGRENSVQADRNDRSGPSLVDSELEALSLNILLNESLLKDNILWDFDPSLEAELKPSMLAFPSQLSLGFLQEPEKNIEYTFLLSSVSDCYGNISESISGKFLRPETSIEELYITEVLFDPFPGGDDFVELFNGSEDLYVDLGALFWRVDEGLMNLTQSFILPPQSYVALTENKAQLLFDYSLTATESVLEVADLPAMFNEQGRLVLENLQGDVLDSIYYLDEYHSPLIVDVEGVSLERLSIAYPATGKNNWSSASSVEGFATPGRENSQKLGQIVNTDQVAVEPRTFIPGSSKPSFSSFATISIRNKAPNRLANIWVVSSLGRIVKTIAKGVLLGSDDFVIWDGTDDGDLLVPMGQYLVVVEFFGGNANVEVLKEPVTVGAQF